MTAQEISMSELRAIADRLAIQDLVTAIARGVDRFDAALLARSILPEAELDMGGAAPISGADFVAMLKPPAKPPHGRMHIVTNHMIRIEGDQARGEAHILSLQDIDTADGRQTRMRAGRYLDRFERRDGRWMLAGRMLVDEWMRSDPLTEAGAPGKNRGRPAPDDLSYVLGFDR